MNILPDTILTNNLSRSDLLSLPLPETFKDISVAVHRNHAFEYVASVLNVFLAQSGLKAQFWYSPYDDSLSFENIPKVDLHLLWLDGTRYQTSSTAEWLKDRIQALQSIAKAPILIFWYGEKISFKDLPSNCILYNLKEELSGLNGSIEDERLTPFSGTRLSNQACLESARILGLISIPPLFFPRIKALALDCDNTLYAGVLGEDGANKLKPYFSLQKKLQELKEEGVLLTLVSKNEEKDIVNLFNTRSDFPLGLEDFAATAINWETKSKNIKQIAHKLNIHTDAILFIDDNLGELLEVAQTLPEVRLLAAKSEEATLKGIKYYPLLHKHNIQTEDLLRNIDIKANSKRKTLQKQLSPLEYRKKLGISLTISLNIEDQIGRIFELLNKTNQFIFTYLRPSEAKVKNFFKNDSRVCITCSLRDSLSDSGLIAILLGCRENETLTISELAVSCRALGRGIENEMLFTMMLSAASHLSCQKVILPICLGERNQPALTWLKSNWPGQIFENYASSSINDLPSHLEGLAVSMQYPKETNSC